MDCKKKYDDALEQAKKELATCGSMDCDAARLIFRLFPQLRESEDERVIRTLFFLCKDHDWFNGATKEECLNWLEKQKGQKHPNGCFTCDEYKKGYEAGRLNGFTAGYNKAMKEVEQKEQKPWKVGANAYFTPEQKPTEWNANDKAFIKDCANILVANDYAASAERLLSMFPIRPAEWSDTNELVFKDICKHLKEEGYNGWIVLLNALRNGEFQPKPAWSEEDERIIDTIVSVLGQYIDYKAVSGTGTGSGYAIPRYSKEIDWLNSLRPQPKQEWSEEDEIRLKEALEVLDESIKYLPMGYGFLKDIMCVKDRLKSLRPSWKPSEEQMSILKKAVEHYRNDWVGATIKEQNTLTSLYEQLKKLGVKEEPEYYQHFDPDC